MSLLDGFIDKAAHGLDGQFGSFDNFAHLTGLDKGLSMGMNVMKMIDPVAAQTVDQIFGAGKAILDQNGNGALEFGELAPIAKTAANLIGL